jgi:hypothetical protein
MFKPIIPVVLKLIQRFWFVSTAFGTDFRSHFLFLIELKIWKYVTFYFLKVMNLPGLTPRGIFLNRPPLRCRRLINIYFLFEVSRRGGTKGCVLEDYFRIT